MKLKYKKLILIISMSTMGIGLVAFSLGNKNSDDEQQKLKSVSLVQGEGENESGDGEVADEGSTVTPTPTVDAQAFSNDPENDEAGSEVADNSEDASEDGTEGSEVANDNPLERDAYPEINKLVKKYLKAKLACDQDALAKVVTDPSYIDIDRLQKTTEFIESYDNLEFYTKKGNGDIDFIVYVYQELKITSIDTLAPAMDELKIKKVDGDYKIVLGEISEETGEYIYETRNSEDVQALIASVNSKAAEAFSQDEDLRAFNTKLEEGATSDKNKSEDDEEVISSTGKNNE